MKKIIVRQNDLKDCGVCCLESIIKYYDGYVPIENLRIDTRTNREGVTAFNLINAAKKYGFEAYGMKTNDVNISNELLPVIAHITTKEGINHFVVVYKITKKQIYVMDPAKGLTKYNYSDFKELWTNVILIFKPITRIPQYNNSNKLINYLINTIQNNSNLFIKIIILNFFITLISIVISYYYKIIISYVENNYINSVFFLIGIFLIFHIIKVYYSHLRTYLSIYLNKNIDITLIPNFIKHIFKLPLYVVKSRTSGEILTRVNELNNIKTFFSEIVITTLLDVTLVLGSTYFLFNINRQLFLILFIIVAIYIIIGFVYSPIINRKLKDSIELETNFNSSLIEKVEAVETIKNLSLTDKILDDIDYSFSLYLNNVFSYEKVLNRFNTLKMIINDIGMFIISSVGIISISKGNMDLITLITFNSLLMYFLDPLHNIVSLVPKYLFIKLSFNKISEFFDLEPEKNDTKEEFKLGKIMFDNISYSYNKSSLVLNNVSFTINDKDHVILKGNSGCGKSTLCKLLNKSIEEYNGNISIAGINIKDYSYNTIRENILYISQREKIFTGTIKENLTLGKDIEIDKLNEVIKITGVEKILDKKSLRLESYLIDGGFNLSGGEKQRIILARAILYNSPILILDESLSELDCDSEKEILNNLDVYLKNTTIIYISHNSNNYFSKTIRLDECYGK